MNDTVTRPRKKILILGAGELGMAMLNGFIRQRATHMEAQLTVLLRPASIAGALSPAQQRRLQWLADNDVAVISADFNAQSDRELAALFAPFDAIINCSGFVGGAGTQRKITQAVLLAGVKRYFPWQFGVDYDRIGKGSGQPVWDEQLAVREQLRAQHHTEWVIVSTGMFISFLFEPLFGVVDIPGKRVVALGEADYALTLTTPADIGMLTAALFFYQPEIKNEVVYVAGDTLSWRELAAVLTRHYGATFTLEVADVARLREAVRREPDDVSAAYRLAFARPDGVAWDKAASWNARHGITVTDVAAWLREEE